jgi:diguanylate cyclase (GGDEF)-like protein
MLSAALRASAGRDLDTTLQAILDVVAAGTDAQLGAAFIQDPDRAGLTLAASVGVADTARLAADAADPADPFAQVVASRAATFGRQGIASDGTATVGAYLPLVLSEGGIQVILGAMGISWPAPHDLDSDEKEDLIDVARLVALVVDRARSASSTAERSEWFERMAHTDPLTGLANERTVGRILELELARAARQGSELSLALFDVDDFRAANATDGHAAGDDILRRVAAVLAESVRLVDTVGRIGGDEFVLVAPGSAGAMVARRVQDGIAARPAVAGRVVSVSAGVVRFPVDGTDPESLIAAATDTLARAKAAGAGTVVEAEAAPSP